MEDFASDANVLSSSREEKAFLATPLVAVLEMITLEQWSGGKGLAIDVAVTSPLAATTYMRKQEPL